MVGDIFLIWMDWGSGLWGRGVVVVVHKEKAPKNIMQSDWRKRNREQINGRNCVAQKNCPTPKVKSILFSEKWWGRGEFFFRPTGYVGFFFPRNPQLEFFFGGQTLFLDFSIIFTAYMWMTCSKGHSCTFLFSMNCFVDRTCLIACFDCICINQIFCGFWVDDVRYITCWGVPGACSPGKCKIFRTSETLF